MHRFRKILVACDERGVSQDLMARVRRLVEANGAAVTLASVVETRPGRLARLLSALPEARVPEVEREVIEERQAHLDRWAGPLRAAGRSVAITVDQGREPQELVRRVLRDGHDLLIKDADREEDWPSLRGPDLRLLRDCPCPVWILNGPGAARSERILAAVDTTPDDDAHDRLNRTVMELATSLARQDDARLDVVSVWDLPEEQALRHGRIHLPEGDILSILARERDRSAARLDELLKAFPDDAGRIRGLHLRGRPAQVLVRHARTERVDTIVMGTVARTGLPGFLMGNTAEAVLARVACSVLAVKPEGFVSPVEPAGA